MLIKFTQMNLCNIFTMQAILYQFKKDMAAWKRLGCSQRMQRTWWQIVAPPYTGFRLLWRGPGPDSTDKSSVMPRAFRCYDFTMILHAVSWYIGRCCIETPLHITWWRHQMETFSTLLALYAGKSPVIDEFSAQRPVMWSFDVFFDLRLNKRLSKQWRGWWFKTHSHPLSRHCNALTCTH